MRQYCPNQLIIIDEAHKIHQHAHVYICPYINTSYINIIYININTCIYV